MKKQLTKLNAKSLNMQSAGGGGNGALTAMDIAGAMAAISDPLGSPLMRYKYAGDRSSKAVLLERFYLRILGVAEKKEWNAKKVSYYGLLAMGVLEEFCDKRCTKCGGRGIWVNNRGVTKTCERCEGTGHYMPTDSARARVLEMSKQSYANGWGDRWEECISMLAEVEATASRTISLQNKGE